MLYSIPTVTRSLARSYSPHLQRVTARGVRLRPSIPVPRRNGNGITRSIQGLAIPREDAAGTTELPASSTQSIPSVALPATAAFAKSLPVVCPGCGAFSQTLESDAPGFFSPQRARITAKRKQEEDKIFESSMSRLENSKETSDPTNSESTSRNDLPLDASPVTSARAVCDRCHDLVYQSKGQSILHPSMESIREMIEASPYQRNHIYHVLDAADFPLSLIPNLVSSLDLPRLRTQNRRSKSTHFSRGRTADVSFIITRSDLLAPRKEQVDQMMPYLQDVLRDALGSAGKRLRLGNVRCVSAKRGWWTPSVKQDVWDRGGAGWVVGKVNVGKSALFEVIFPKGRSHSPEEVAKLAAVRTRHQNVSLPEENHTTHDAGSDLSITSATDIGASDALASEPDNKDNHASESPEIHGTPTTEHEPTLEEDGADSLLPPAQPETQYPHMPVVSALPGTTASPIRLPYGKGRGELIDLPGIQRSSIETHVCPEHHASLVMKGRVVPQQYTVKSGQSLLIGGMVRITPKTGDLNFLAYPFTPLQAHVTGHEKAIAIQTGKDQDGSQYNGRVSNIATDIAKQRIKSAGTFRLEWDVTNKRSGPLTSKDAGKMKSEYLPFTVYGADILIESIGWVELVCQVRNRHRDLENPYPEVEVFSPKGKFIAIRKPMNAWLLGGPKQVPKHARKSRPRMSISMYKRKEGGKTGAPNTKTTPN